MCARVNQASQHSRATLTTQAQLHAHHRQGEIYTLKKILIPRLSCQIKTLDMAVDPNRNQDAPKYIEPPSHKTDRIGSLYKSCHVHETQAHCHSAMNGEESNSPRTLSLKI